MSFTCSQAFYFFVRIQRDFSERVCSQIFTDRETEQVWGMWLTCNGNVIEFLFRIGDNNRSMILMYYARLWSGF
jgi:hypothetical protein